MSALRTAVCLFVRDEERDIAEWLAYQIAVGFDACLVYDNDSADRTRDIVQRFGRKFDVRLRHWPVTTALAQPACYRVCLDQFGQEFDWIAFIDSDELIAFRDGDIRSLLASRHDAPAIAVNWAVFGSSKHVKRPPGLMIETFTRRAKSDFPPNRMAKFIVRPRLVVKVRAPCNFLVDGTPQTPAGRPVRWLTDGKTTTVEHSVAKLNHYFTKDRQDWDRKRARGYRSGGLGGARARNQFSAFDRNEIEDRSALRFAPGVRESLEAAGCCHQANHAREG